jgi:hypothetical protein
MVYAGLSVYKGKGRSIAIIAKSGPLGLVIFIDC